jgi:hypothetical protein
LVSDSVLTLSTFPFLFFTIHLSVHSPSIISLIIFFNILLVIFSYRLSIFPRLSSTQFNIYIFLSEAVWPLVSDSVLTLSTFPFLFFTIHLSVHSPSSFGGWGGGLSEKIMDGEWTERWMVKKRKGKVDSVSSMSRCLVLQLLNLCKPFIFHIISRFERTSSTPSLYER